MKTHIEVSAPVELTARVRQMSSLFDLPLQQYQSLSWDHDLPLEDEDWNVGLVTGPSGAGKTLLANRLWPGRVIESYEWPADRSLLDAFPAEAGIKQVTNYLTSVGLGSPPAWVRPFRTLSNGEAFRATIARALAESDGLTVVDEFTSVVDRQVAKVASHTVQKAVRKAGRQLVAVTCHYDVIDWLQPDWVYDVASREFTWRSVQPHPPVSLEIYACERRLWAMFARYHYLSGDLATSAKCFAGYVEGRPVVFEASRHFPHPAVKDIIIGHRMAVLPDWQGLGIASAVLDWEASYWYEHGKRYRSVTSHPALIAYHSRSPRWRETTPRGNRSLGSGTGLQNRRTLRRAALDVRQLGTRSFEYVPARED